MTRVDFYQLRGARWQGGACARVEALAAAGARVYLWAGSEAEARQFDELLWTFREDSFVPHDPWDGRGELDTPVAVGWHPGNPNRADCLVLVRDAGPDEVRPFPRVIDFVPQDVPDLLPAPRARFAAFRAAGFAVEFHPTAPG